MAKFSLITFKITNGDSEHYEYSNFEYKNISGITDKEIVEDFLGSEVEVCEDDEHKFWFNDSRTIEVYKIDPMTYVEWGVLKRFGVL